MAQLSDKELMREFYKSGASDFRKFKSAHLQQISRSAEGAASTPVARANNYSVSQSPAAPSPQAAQPVLPATISQKAPPVSKVQPAAKTPAAAVAAPIITSTPSSAPIPATVSIPPQQQFNNTAASASFSQSTMSAASPTNANGHPALAGLNSNADGDAASRQYIQFLQQQQEVQRSHQRLQQQLERLSADRKACQQEVAQARGVVADLLHELESGKDWNLKSKYGVATLLKDAMLKLQPRDLYHPDMKPQYLDLIQQQGNLDKLRKDHAKHPSYGDFKSHLDNAVRRLERAEKEIKASQLDGTNIARLPDTYFIQLDHILSTPTIEDVLQETENNMEDLAFKLEDTKEKREQSLDEGEMQRAEEQYYDVVNHYEGILQLIREKLRTLERIKKESLVFDKVRQQYQEKAAEEAVQLKREKEILKEQCEADLRNVFALKEKVDAVEASTNQKLREDVQASDAVLKKNDERIGELWNQMRVIEVELLKVEAERHAEVRRRVGMKEKDETRQMEYQRFCEVVEKHTALLELTINNCDTGMHTTSLLGEMVNSGFNALQIHLHNHDNKYAQMLLDTHKQHLEQFRGLYLSLGELAHKKEKKIEEIDQAIKTNHIQQELAMDTLNPSAKKFSDAKKLLLRQRDQVDQELRELKEKAQYALDNFRESEHALHVARFAFVHPVVEQQEAALEMKAKMVEYRAIAVGNVDALPIQQELQEIKKQLYETLQATDPRSSMMNTTLPAITM